MASVSGPNSSKPTTAQIVGGSYNAAEEVLVDGQASSLQLDINGKLITTSTVVGTADVNIKDVNGSAPALTNPLPVELSDGTNAFGTSGNPLYVNVASDGSVVSNGNSTTTPLNAGASFTGTVFDALNYSQVTVLSFSDQSSVSNGLQIQYSNDGTHWDHDVSTTANAGESASIQSGIHGRYVRVVYTNGSVNQATFRLQALFNCISGTATIRDLDTLVGPDDNAMVVRAVLSGQSIVGTRYTDVSTDHYGSLMTSIGGQSADAFGRTRIANPVSLFDSQFQYDTQPLLFQTSLSGTGTVAKTANESSLTLSTGGTASGATAINQTKQYFRYEPGKSQQILLTGILGAKKTNVRSRIGYFDANDGVFFEMNGSDGAAVVQRSSTSGSPVDTRVLQANWNVDKMDGTGPSGVTINFALAQIFVTDFQWLGVGRVRFGFFVDGELLICHQIFNANVVSLPYMNTANLPVRAEIANTGTAASSTDMKQICMAVVSEGGIDHPAAYQFSASNGVTAISVSTRRPILSISPKTTFNSITNRVSLVLDELKILASSGSVYWELVYNGTLTGASFSSVNSNSVANFDVAATAISGGTVLASGFASGGGDTSRGTSVGSLTGLVPMTLDLAGSTADILSLVCTAFTGSVNTNGAMTWHEVR